MKNERICDEWAYLFTWPENGMNNETVKKRYLDLSGIFLERLKTSEKLTETEAILHGLKFITDNLLKEVQEETNSYLNN